MKKKSLLLATLAILLIFSGCSKKEDVTVEENDLMKFYKSIEVYDGMTIQAAKADLNDKGYRTVAHDSGKYEFEKTEDNVIRHITLKSNSGLDNFVYYITIELKGAGSQATMTQRSSYVDFVKCFGQSRKIPSGQIVAFWVFYNGEDEVNNWSEMLNKINESSSMLDVSWESEGNISCAIYTTWKNNSIDISIYDGTYAPGEN